MKKHFIEKQVWYALLILLVGCIPSLHALYTDKDLTFDPALIGTWYTGEGQANFVFTQGKDKAYNVVYTDRDGKTGQFVGHLLKLNDTMFLDLYPNGDIITQSDYYKGHLVPAHSFMRVDAITPKPIFCDMDYDWMKKYLKDNPTALAHELIGDTDNDSKELVLTASTDDLQKFVLAHLNDDGLFKPTTLSADKPAAP